MFNPGLGEWLLVAVVVIILFGAKRLPEVAESFGKSIKAFKKGMREADEPDPPAKKLEETKPKQ